MDKKKGPKKLTLKKETIMGADEPRSGAGGTSEVACQSLCSDCCGTGGGGGAPKV